jgi:hypothetical protein
VTTFDDVVAVSDDDVVVEASDVVVGTEAVVVVLACVLTSLWLGRERPPWSTDDRWVRAFDLAATVLVVGLTDRRVAAVELSASSTVTSKPARDVMSTPRFAFRSRRSAWSRLRCPSFMDNSLGRRTKNRLLIG